ncbi:hypothetical protein EV176_006774, partial [Coemansia sp. RSA 451]
LLEYSYLQATEIDLDTDRHLPLNIQKEMTQQLKRTGKQHAVVSGQLLLAAGEIRLERIDDSSTADSSSQDAETKAKSKPDTQVAEAVRPSIRMAANLDNYDLSAWTPERLASELGDIGLNAAAVDDTTDASSNKKKLVRITIPSGTATIRMHGGWTVDCTSVNTQWVVLDSLRQVLKAG